MSDVNLRVFEYFERHADTYGYTLEELVEGCPLTLAELQTRGGRVSWEIWSDLCARFEVLVGGPAATIEAGESVAQMEFFAPVRLFASSLIAPSAVYAPMVRFLGPVLFRSFLWEVRTVGHVQVSLAITVPDHQEVSQAWFRMVEGAMRTVPTLVGGRPAVVQHWVDGQVGRFEITCPQSLSFWSRTWRRIQRFIQGPAMLEELEALQINLQEAYQQVAGSEREVLRALDGLAEPVALVSSDKILWANSIWTSDLGPELPAGLMAATQPTEIELLDSAGRARTYEVPARVPLLYEGREAEQVLLRDITAIREAANRGRVADRLAALGTLAASVGHELNNPLAYAMTHLTLLQEQIDELPAERRDALRADTDMVLDGLTRVAAITHDLQTISRESSASEPVSMGEVVEAAMRLASSEVRAVATPEVVIADNLPPVWGSAARLTQVVLNLVVNAAHAMDEYPSDDHRLRVVASASPKWLLVSVQDTGPGIPAADRGRVFEPFFTTKAEGRGTGLGLSVCRRIVEDHGGRLELAVGRKRGTVMTIHLPVSKQVLAAIEPASGRPSRCLRVLFVDDEVPLLRAVARLLRPHEVTTISDPMEIAEHLDTDWDAIVLDVAMRTEDGPSVYARLPAHQQARVVFVTGGVFQDSSRARLAELARPIIAKPFTKEGLLAALWSVAS